MKKESEPEKIYIQPKNPKVMVVENAQAAGIDCLLDSNSIVIFRHTEKERVEEWLHKNYAVDGKIPFSYGFCEVYFDDTKKK